MSERVSHQIDQVLLDQSIESLGTIRGLDAMLHDDPIGSFEGQQEIELEFFAGLHLQTYQHEYQYGSRLSVCRSILEGVTALNSSAVREGNQAKKARFGAMALYANAAYDGVTNLIEPELHTSLVDIVSSGGMYINIENGDEVPFPERDHLRQLGLTIERSYGKKVEVTPTAQGVRTVEVQKARDEFDSTANTRPVKPYPTAEAGVKMQQ